jgi:PhzF family phenazine biosynthesis protein
MSIRIVQVDAFTARPFAGNPAAVCVLHQPVAEEWLKDVAREMNLSETAFLWPGEDGYRLRWLTPSIEVDLCGHATLASAHVLWEDKHLPEGAQARFHTRSGLLLADRRGEWIELDFPAKVAVQSEEPPQLLEALGVDRAVWLGRNVFDCLVELDSEQAVRTLKPDFSALGRLTGLRGVIVTARAESAGYDFVSRFFAPGAGVDEDPVTGSAHTALGPYWAPLLNKTEFTAYQASARGGIVRVRLQGDRVILGGQAVTVMTGDLVA